MTFFNSNTGSRMADEQDIPFCYKEELPSKIIQITQLDPKSTIDVEGKLKWLEERKVICKQSAF